MNFFNIHNELVDSCWNSFVDVKKETKEIIQTIDVFVHFIYLHQYPAKKKQLIGSFWEQFFSQRFDEEMISKMAAMRSLIMQNEKKKKKNFPL
jgi:hypothetical protein